MRWFWWIPILIVIFWIGWAIAANFKPISIQLIGRSVMFLSVIILAGICIHQINKHSKP